MQETPKGWLLVVDDKEAMRYATSRMLRSGGWTVVEAGTGREALEQARFLPDLIVLNIHLPDIDGFEVARILKADPATASIPVLHLTPTCNESEDRAISLEGGADAFLKEPVGPRELLATVGALLRMREAERRVQQELTERRRTEEEVRRSEEDFRFLFESSIVGELIARPTGEIRVNDALARMLGYEKAELAEMRWQDVTHPDDVEETQSQMAFLLSGQKGSVRYKKRFLRKDGSVVWAEIISSIRRDGSGTPLYFVTTALDISEQRRTEEALRASEFRWRFAIEGSGDGLWDWNVPESTVFFSTHWKNMLGFVEDEIGSGLDEWSKRVHPDDLARVMAEVQAHLDGTTPSYVSEHRVRCKDGSWKWILDRGLVVSRDGTGKPLRVIGTHKDITERKRAEEALRASEEKYRQIVETTHDGVWMIDVESRTTFVNRRMGEILGYTPEEMLGQPLFRFMTDEGRAVAERNVERRKMGIAEEHDFCFQRKNGSAVWTMIGTTPVIEPDGTYAGALASVTDITERKVAEEALRESETRFRAVLDASPVPMAMNDEDMNITLLNPAFVETFGYTSRDIPTIADWWPRAYPDPDYRRRIIDDWQVRIERAKRTGMPFERVEVTVRAGDGSDRTVLVSATPLSPSLKTDNLVVLYDISDRKSAEEEIRKLNEDLENRVLARTADLAVANRELES